MLPSEDAVEHGELAIFLRLNEKWDPEIDGEKPVKAPKPIGVPGAHMPSQMNKDHKPSYSKIPPLPPDKKREDDEFDVSTELSGFGLQGVKMTNDELQQLAQELGLGKDDAANLAKGLGNLDIEDAVGDPSDPSNQADDKTTTVDKGGVEQVGIYFFVLRFFLRDPRIFSLIPF